MKKVLVLVLTLLLVGCSSDDDGKIHIGILQQLTHESLDLAYDGFIDALKDGGYKEGDNLVINYQNPNNDTSSLQTMSGVLVNDNPKLILAIGTSAAQSLSKETSDIAILGTAITDYVDVGLVKSNDKPGSNISGCSDFMNMEVQMNLIDDILDDVQTIGLLYSSNEENSYIQAKEMKIEAQKRGWKVIEKTICDLTMVNDTLLSMIDEINALYIPTDNQLASSIASVDIIAKEYQVPVFTGWDSGVKDGALASVGVNYYDLGYQTGLYAIQLIEDKVNISELPIYYSDYNKATIYYNSNTAKIINLNLSENITKNAIDLANK